MLIQLQSGTVVFLKQQFDILEYMITHFFLLKVEKIDTTVFMC